MDFSTALRDAILESYFRSVALYLSFNSGDLGRTGTGGADITSSVTSGGRLLIPSTTWSAVTAVGNAREISNTSSFSLGNAPSSITNAQTGLWTAASGGIFRMKFSTPFTTTAGQPYTIGIGALRVQMP